MTKKAPPPATDDPGEHDPDGTGRTGTVTGFEALAATVLAEEDRQRADTGPDLPELDLAELPGVQEEEVDLDRGFAMGGGRFTFLVIMLLTSLDELQTAALSVLGPDIGESL